MPAALWPASWATAAAEGRGERGRAAPGTDSPPQISEEVARREGCDGHGHGGRAAAMGSASRGGQG